VLDTITQQHNSQPIDVCCTLLCNAVCAVLSALRSTPLHVDAPSGLCAAGPAIRFGHAGGHTRGRLALPWVSCATIPQLCALQFGVLLLLRCACVALVFQVGVCFFRLPVSEIETLRMRGSKLSRFFFVVVVDAQHLHESDDWKELFLAATFASFSCALLCLVICHCQNLSAKVLVAKRLSPFLRNACVTSFPPFFRKNPSNLIFIHREIGHVLKLLTSLSTFDETAQN
jgi:hypothetical protein